MTATELATLIVLKLSACLVSLASGFRGGMFFASLFVGSLLGKLYWIGVDALAPSMGLETTACVLVGMGALSAAIVGGPLTMTFLVLESTGNLGVAGGALRLRSRPRSRCGRPSAIRSPLGACICAARRSAAARMSAGCVI